MLCLLEPLRPVMGDRFLQTQKNVRDNQTSSDSPLKYTTDDRSHDEATRCQEVGIPCNALRVA